MKKTMFIISIFIMFLLLTPNVYALTASEVSSRGTDCVGVELAEAKEDGSLNKISCHNSYDEAKQVMNTTENDNLVIIEGKRIIDAKYAFIDYDQYTSLKYINVYDTKNLNNNITYIAGGNSDDAVFLELDYQTGRIKIKVAGVTGWIKRYENESSMQNIQYDIVPLSWVTSPSYYEINDNDIIHHLPVNVYNTKGKNSITIGKKPTMVNNGNYYSFDGNYFYTDLKTMINDYKNGVFTNSVNSSSPYYNYYQYLSFRSKTNYSASHINQFIDARTTKKTSKLKNTGEYFINSQNRYGVNAIIMLAIGINESGYGNSNIAQTKNNLFGLNAVDVSPGASADAFLSVESCINDFGFAWLSGKFLQPGDYRYNGAVLGNKSVGLNIKYASDPYWGEKAAAYYYDMDKYFGFQDYENYTVAVLNNNYSNTVYAKKTPGGLNVSSSYYQYKKQSSPVIVLEEVTGPDVNGNTIWYKVTSDPVLDSNLEYYSDDTYYNTKPRIMYNWATNLVYVPAVYFTKISNGGGKIEITEVTPEGSTVTPSVTPSPSPSSNPTDGDTNNTPEVSPSPTPVAKPISSVVEEASYKYDSGKITGIKVGTKIEDIINNLTNTGGVVIITDSNNNQVTTGNIGTGYKVNITSSNLNEVLTVIIYGDTDGDGNISAVDYVRVKNHIMGASQLDDINKLSADVNNDNDISAVDYVNIKNYIMGGNSVIER